MNALSLLRIRSAARHFQRHRIQLLLAVIGVSVGVAAVTAIDLARRSVDQAFASSVQTVSGRATHRITGTGGKIHHDQYLLLRRTLGWIPMAPVVERSVIGPDGSPWTLLGLDLIREAPFARAASGWEEMTEFPARAWFAGEPLVLLPAGANSGPRWRFSLGNKTIEAEVAGRFAVPGGSRQRLAVADIGTVQAWTGLHNAIDAIDVVTDDAALTALAAALPPSLRIEPRRASNQGLTQAFEMNLTALSLLTALVGIFIVYNTFNFLVVQRRPQFELEYSLGISRRSQRRQVLGEALALGLVGSALGSVLGILLGRFTLRLVERTVSDLYYETGSVALLLEPQLAAKALGVGVVSCLLAAWRPAYRTAGRSRRSAAISAAFSITALALGAILLAVPGPLLLALGGVFGVALGYSTLGGPGLALAAAPVVRALSLARAPLFGLSLRRLPQALDRTLPAVAALTLAVATVCGVGTMIDSFRNSVSQWLEQSLSADYYVRARDGTLSAEIQARVQSWPEVRAVSRFLTGDARLDGKTIELSAQDLTERGRRSYEFIAGDEDVWDRFERQPVALATENLARAEGLTPGQTLSVKVGGRMLELTLAGVVVDYRTGPGRLIVSWRTYERAFGPTRPSALGLYLAPDAEPQTVQRRAADLVAADRNLQMSDTGAIRARSLDIFDETFELTRALQWIAALVALVGLTGTLMALQLERRDEFRLLEALGLSRNDQRRAVRLEALSLGAVIAIFALPLGGVLAWALTAVINPRAFGWRLNLEFSATPPTLAVGIALVGAWVAGALAAREHTERTES